LTRRSTGSQKSQKSAPAARHCTQPAARMSRLYSEDRFTRTCSPGARHSQIDRSAAGWVLITRTDQAWFASNMRQARAHANCVVLHTWFHTCWGPARCVHRGHTLLLLLLLLPCCSSYSHGFLATPVALGSAPPSSAARSALVSSSTRPSPRPCTRSGMWPLLCARLDGP
jgi:hypothetical protein